MDGLHSPGALDSPDALVRLALSGDEAAFARIVRLHREAMVRVAFVVTGDARRAVDAVAATWPIAWSRLGRIRDASRLGPWLCTVAAEEAGRVARSRSRLPADARIAGLVDGAAPAGAGPSDAGSTLAGALAELRPEDRALLALRYVAGLTPAELGRAAGMPAAAVADRTRELAERVQGGEDLGERLRAYADVPVPPVDIDAVARGAAVVRHDHRVRIVSLAIAIVVAIVVVAVPYLGDRGAAPVTVPGATPSPAPTTETATPSPTPGD